VAAELDAAAAQLDTGEVVREHAAQEARDAGRPALADDHVGARLERVDGVGDRDADLAGLEQRVVVLGVADADDVVVRDAQIAERLEQPGALRHAGGQHHERLAVADDLQLEPGARDLLEHDLGVARVHREQHVAGVDGHAARRERRAQRGADGRRERPCRLARTHHLGAVLGDDRVEVPVDVGEVLAQIAHDPPGHQQHAPARAAQRGDRVEHDRLGARPVRDGAVVVHCHGPEVARHDPSTRDTCIGRATKAWRLHRMAVETRCPNPAPARIPRTKAGWWC
jgi:hypothetical protein